MIDSKERINEINGKMAVFIGYKFIKKAKWWDLRGYGCDVFKKPNPFGIAYSHKNLKFHYDWNWLMQCVDKIESLGYFVMINKWSSVYTGSDGDRISVTSVESGGKHFNTWYAVSKFIDWYNEQNKDL